MKKIIVMLLTAVSMTASASAALTTFTKEYIYQASDADSKLTSRAIALEQTKRLLLEEVGVFIESQTEVRNFQLTKDQISIITAGIVRTDIIEESWDGKVYRLKAKIVIDPSEIAKSVNTIRSDRQKLAELNAAVKRSNALFEEIESLKKELAVVKAAGRDNIQKRYANAIKGLSATEWYEQGISLTASEKFSDAIKAFDRAIDLDAGYASAYYNRGLLYSMKGFHKEALEDMNEVVRMNPDVSSSYSGRAHVYGSLGNYNAAIDDLQTALLMDKNNDDAWFLICTIGLEYGKYKETIYACSKAIEFHPSNANAYMLRGRKHYINGNLQVGIDDLKVAARLGSGMAQSLLREKGISW